METWWQPVLDMLSSEFSDLSQPVEMLRLALRLAVAAVLGSLLGLERARRGKAAGIRTHMLVAIGCALFVAVPHLSGAGQDAMSRVVQGVATGIGFIGAGTILKSRSQHEVYGLTTAAGIWLTAAIGIAAGSGRTATAAIATLLALSIMRFIPKVPSDDDEDDDSSRGHM